MISQKKFSGALHQFNPDWFKEYKNWLEHIIKKKMIRFVYIITYLGNMLVIE